MLDRFFEIWTVQMPIGFFVLGALIFLSLFYRAVRCWVWLMSRLRSLKKRASEREAKNEDEEEKEKSQAA